MNAAYRFLKPVDVLYLRGNKLFGAAGDHAEPLMPPWPSVFSGALRSRLLADFDVPFSACKAGTLNCPPLEPVLGSYTLPGSFELCHVTLGRESDGNADPLFPLPADVIVEKHGEKEPSRNIVQLEVVSSESLAPLCLSLPEGLSHVPLLRTGRPSKVESDFFMPLQTLVHYLAGDRIHADDLVPASKIWSRDSRLGIALETRTRTVETGRIYTTDTIALADCMGFIVGVKGEAGLLPSRGLLRLGGDGRAASMMPIRLDASWLRVPRGKGFKVIMATPGLFPQGWLPPGIVFENDHFLLRLGGLKARLVACALARAQVVSGWDLALDEPKPAVRAVPTGSVYWFEVIEGSTEPLCLLLEKGLWPLMEKEAVASFPGCLQRRAEGFNRIWLGEWAP